MSHLTAPLFPQPVPESTPHTNPDPPDHTAPNRNPAHSTPAEWVIAHCDGGARGNPGPAGYGAVLRNQSGVVLAELSVFLGNRTNNYAEYSGLLGCLQWTLDHGYHRLRVVSDSELMVKQIQGRYKVNSPDLRPLWQEARRRIAQLDQFEISHALRHKNKHADRLANDAMDRGANTPVAKNSLAENPTPSHPPHSTASAPTPTAPEPSSSAAPTSSQPFMLRGVTRNGAIHLLGGQTLPDGIFVKIIPEESL
ncbi:MAG: ribonuclease HI family protein [Acidobacteriaceae bacterium]